MKYQLRNQNEIHELLGVKNVEKLFEYIRKGALKKNELEKMSYDYNLNVSQTFQDCSEARERPFKILERLGKSSIKIKSGEYKSGEARTEIHHWRNCTPKILPEGAPDASRTPLGRRPKQSA